MLSELDPGSIADVSERVVSDSNGRRGALALIDGSWRGWRDGVAVRIRRRSYGQGAAHFVCRLEDPGVELDAVGRATVVEYIAEFSRGDGRSGGVGRAPRTGNHHVSVPAALLAHWAHADVGRLAGREPPLPVVRSAPGLAHQSDQGSQPGLKGSSQPLEL